MAIAALAALRRAWSPEVVDVFAEVEPTLVELGRTAPFREFERAVRHVADAADPLRADANATLRVARREVHASRTSGCAGSRMAPCCCRRGCWTWRCGVT